MDLRFDRYYDNDEMTEALRALADAHPTLARLESLGTTYEGRDIPLLVLTDESTGPDTEKPAFWLSGNIHAIEVASSMACLHAAWTLLDGAASDERLANLLQRGAFYVVPRISPDGAARVFETPRKIPLSGPRTYPFGEVAPGLAAEDVDGDGRILDMRVRDANGPYKVSDVDPRLMVRRAPDEEGGQYYVLLPEGRITDYDGHRIGLSRSTTGLNLNRNFPVDWGPETSEQGAGPFPLSEPETRAVADFIASHPNIVSAIDYHTYSGIHLRPYGGRDDVTMPLEDLWVWQAMGRRATELTGYAAVSIWHGFRYHPTKGMHGAFLDWLYEHRGVYGWTTELWDMCREAGLDRSDLIAWHHDHPVEDDLALLRWNDAVLGGRAFVDWYEVDHPELGRVELGGWDRVFAWNNPPEELLEAELAKNTPFVLFLASLAPRLELRALAAEAVGPTTWQVTAVVDNLGYLPTSGSQKAIASGVVRPVAATLRGGTVLDGPERREVGHLQGRSNKGQFAGIAPVTPTDMRGLVRWLVSAEPGTELSLEVTSERAGVLRASLVLGDASG